MFIITFTAGTGQDKSGHPLNYGHFRAALENIRDRLALEAGGYTEYVTLGGWHNGESVVTEPGREWRVAVIHGEPEAGDAHALTSNWAKSMAQFIAQQLDQASVMMTIQSVPVTFVPQEVQS